MNQEPEVLVLALIGIATGLFIGVILGTFPGWLVGKATARRHARQDHTLHVNTLTETKPRRWTLMVVGFLWFAVWVSISTESQTGLALLGCILIGALGLAVANYAAFFIGYTATAERIAHRSASEPGWPA